MRFGLVSYIAIASAFAVPQTSFANATDGAEEVVGGEIFVTARKRSEDILKTPVTIAVMSSEDLAKKSIASVSDLASNTPAMNVNSNNSGRNDRSFQQIVMRGFAPTNAQSTTVSTFIDGVPVSSPTAFNGVTDPARIEMLKGPQSAFFGRNTFAGAVNVVNKEPGDEFGGSISAMAGTRENYRIHADVEGPILGDLLGFRLSGDMSSKNGSYKNTFSGDTLGDQSSKSISGFLVARPASNLTLKAFGMYLKDKDGAPAQGLISAVGLTDATGKVIVPNQSNCTMQSGRPGICGIAPTLINGPSANTTNDSFVTNFLSNPRGRLINPKDGVQGYGLVRNYYHLHLNVDYDVTDQITISSLTGMNREQYSQFADMDNYGSTSLSNSFTTAGSRPYFDYPFLVERKNSDFSQELRAAYDGGALKATVGASYLNNWAQGANGGGAGALGTSVFASTAGMTQSKTKGAFYALSYAVDGLTLNAEGRYQIDTLYAFAQPGGLNQTSSVFVPAGYYAEGDQLLKKTYKNFLPRFIAQYEFTPEVMMYLSWSKGVNPGMFNTNFLTRTPVAQAAAAASGIGLSVEPEKVTNYEIGFKGRAFDNRLRYSLSAYYAEWRNQTNQLAVSMIDAVTGENQLVTGSSNTGSVNMKGVELETSFIVSDLLSLSAAGAYTGTDVRTFVSPTVTGYTGLVGDDFRGKEMPFTSKYSFNAGADFHGDIRGVDGATWFARADYIYRSGVWSNQANVLRTRDIHKVNVRAGVARDNVSLDVFVTNLFNNKSYTTVGDHWLVSPNLAYMSVFSAAVVGLPELRTAGVQLKYSF